MPRMLKRFLALIGFGGPEEEGRQLARDTRAILDMIHGQHGAESLLKIAGKLRRHIDLVHEKGMNEPQYYGRGVTELTELNRAARARQDNLGWSGITLAVIYIKAEMIGPPGFEARNAINGFLAEWAHALDEALPDGDED